MRLLTLFISFIGFFSSAAFAHTDHALGEGSIHALYHFAFWTLFVVVIYKAYVWFRAKKSQEQ